MLCVLFSSQSTDADTGIVGTLDQVFALLRLEAQSIVAANPQVRMLDFYTLSAVSTSVFSQGEGMHCHSCRLFNKDVDLF